jgi:hypothetical protein
MPANFRYIPSPLANKDYSEALSTFAGLAQSFSGGELNDYAR